MAQGNSRDTSEVTFLEIAQRYADAMIAHGRDHYGPEDSPLFAAMLDRQSLSLIGASVGSLPEIKGVDTNERSWGAANPAHHEQLYKLLYKLTERTGEPRYAQAADSALGYFFRHAQSPETGLLAWGEHLGWSLRNDAPLDLGTKYQEQHAYEYTHEMLPWHLWPQAYRLAPAAAVRFAKGLWENQVHDARGRFSRHARYDAHGPKKGADFPRYGGNMILAWARAYANTEDAAVRREMITAIETIAEAYDEHRNSQSGAIPVSWSSCRWDSYRCHQYWSKSVLRLVNETGIALNLPLPDSTKTVLRKMARHSDQVLLKLDHEAKKGKFLHRAHLETLDPGSGHRNRGSGVAYTALWTQPGSPLTSMYALQMLQHYEQTGIQKYRTLALEAASPYLDSMPDRSQVTFPKALAFAIKFMLRVYRMTGEERYLQRASTFGKTAATMFLSASSPLPKASTAYEDYEALTRGDDLMLAFLNVHTALEQAGKGRLSAVRLEPVPLKAEDNYPNPFARETTIGYWIPQRENVSMRVYDVLGRRVAVVHKTAEARGYHEIDFEPDAHLASGVYVYRLRAGDQRVTGKMVLVR